jgi:hypothetical protein
MKIKSQAFLNNGRIPKKYTGEGEDISPPLLIENLPEGTETIALIVDDPDAPMGTFDHWIVWNIEPSITQFNEGQRIGIEGENHFNETGYRGPMPPPGPTHRYFFKVFALDTSLDLPEGSTKEELEDAIEGHVLAHAEIIGTYSR